MSGSNDGHSMQLWPYGQAAGQDQKYFPLGTSKALPAREYRGLTAPGSTDEEKLENGLTMLLGSREAAQAYMRQRQASKGNKVNAPRT
jgi:hypothetical protein